MDNLKINLTRLTRFLTDMAQIGATPLGGCNRQALTELDREGRALFLSWCEKIGGQPRLDSCGNLFVRFAGIDNNLAPVFMGSHLDTQPTGGKYDGVYGVLAALEVMYTLHEKHITPTYPIDLVVWCNEEGARFVPAMAGSGVFAGQFTQEEIYAAKDDDGISYYNALVSSGQLGKLPCKALPFSASLELHIEQGPVLEAEGKTVGVVTGVQGMNWYEVTLSGQSVHAGPTPMTMRRDPVLAMAQILNRIYALVDTFGPDARVTVGKVHSSLSAVNTVPEKMTFTLDLRHPDQAALDAMSAQVLELCRTTSELVSCEIATLWLSPAVKFAEKCINAVSASCEVLGMNSRPIVSGAGHDSVYLSGVGPTGMIFIPCKDGISHNELEHAEPEWLEAGANVLLHSLLRLTK